MSEDVIIKGEVGYNRQDPKALPVFGFAIAIIITLVLCFIFVISYYGWALEAEQYRFQAVPVAQDYKTIQATESQLLNQYGYANKERTVVRLTLDRAMELTLKEAQAKKTFYPTAPAPVKVDAAAAGAAAAGAPAAPAAPVQPEAAAKH
jgi:hypothetical protein